MGEGEVAAKGVPHVFIFTISFLPLCLSFPFPHFYLLL